MQVKTRAVMTGRPMLLCYSFGAMQRLCALRESKTMKHIKNWRVKLKAEAALLEKLSYEFKNPELYLFHDSNLWFLESSYFDSEMHSETYAIGEKLIDYLNHTLWLYAYRFKAIESDGYYSLNEKGEWVNDFLGFGQLVSPTRLIVRSNDIPDRKILAVFTQNLKVQESLSLFANTSPDWVTLFKIYETVRDDKSESEDGIALIKEWTGETDNKRFFDTANWHRHSAHGRFRKEPNKLPDNPMPLSEAQRFIRKMLMAWLDSKSSIKSQMQPRQ